MLEPLTLVAKQLGISRLTLTKRVWAGSLTAEKRGRRLYIDRAQVTPVRRHLPRVVAVADDAADVGDPDRPHTPVLQAALDAVCVLGVVGTAGLVNPRIGSEEVRICRSALVLVLASCGMPRAEALGRLAVPAEVQTEWLICSRPEPARALYQRALPATLRLLRNHERTLEGLMDYAVFSVDGLATRLGRRPPALGQVAAYLAEHILGLRDIRPGTHSLMALQALAADRALWALVAGLLVRAGRQGAIHRMLRHADLMRVSWHHDPYAVLGVAPESR